MSDYLVILKIYRDDESYFYDVRELNDLSLIEVVKKINTDNIGMRFDICQITLIS